MIAGYVDSMGYVRCAKCSDGLRGGELPVRQDSHPHAYDDCDACGEQVNKATTLNTALHHLGLTTTDAGHGRRHIILDGLPGDGPPCPRCDGVLEWSGQSGDPGNTGH